MAPYCLSIRKVQSGETLAYQHSARRSSRPVRNIAVVQESAGDQTNLHRAKVFACGLPNVDRLLRAVGVILHLEKGHVLCMTERQVVDSAGRLYSKIGRAHV